MAIRKNVWSPCRQSQIPDHLKLDYSRLIIFGSFIITPQENIEFLFGKYFLKIIFRITFRKSRFSDFSRIENRRFAIHFTLKIDFDNSFRFWQISIFEKWSGKYFSKNIFQNQNSIFSLRTGNKRCGVMMKLPNMQ